MNADRLLAIMARNGRPMSAAAVEAEIARAMARPLLSEQNPKTLKGRRVGWQTAILHLAPSLQSGLQMCGSETEGCADACLYSAGRGGFDARIPACRIRKSLWLAFDPDGFLARLDREIGLFVKRARARGYRPCVRLNGTSDRRWERTGLLDAHRRVQFYDYTKHPNRTGLPRNYYLTRSASERMSADDIRAIVASGMNVAVVFRSAAAVARAVGAHGSKRWVRSAGILTRRMALPDEWNGARVVDGDQSDLRFKDPAGVIVGLRAKGDALLDASGFVRDIA